MKFHPPNWRGIKYMKSNMGSDTDTVDFSMIDELMDKKIGEIDLTVLGRTYRLIKMYLETSAEMFRKDDGGESLLLDRLSQHVLCDGPYNTERTLALMIVFEEIMSGPAYLMKVEKTLNKVLGI